MQEEKTILKTKTSQINNIFFCFVTFIIFLALFYYHNIIFNMFLNLYSMFSDLASQNNRAEVEHFINESITSFINSNSLSIVEFISIVAVSFLFIGFPLFLGLWKILQTYCKTYTFTTQRLLIDYGVLTKRQEQIEFYRIKDKYTVDSIFLRPFGLTHYFLISTDRTKPLVKVKAIKNLEQYRQTIHQCIGQTRTTNQGREIELV